jgi:hypothetical protein
MKHSGNRYWSAAAAAILTAVAVGGTTTAAQAQGSEVRGGITSPGTQEPRVSALRFEKTAAKEVVAQLSKQAGVTVVADSRVSLAQVTLQTIGGTLGKVLGEVTAQLPKGTVVHKVMLPAFAPNVTADGDLIVATYLTQEKLVGNVMGAKVERSAGDINVLGKILSAEKAAPIIDTLELKPVYVLTIDNNDDPVARANQLQSEGMRLWAQMTPEQRSRMMDEQFNGLMNMEPSARQAIIGQMMQQGLQMMQKMQQLPPDQQRKLGEEFRQAVPPGMIKQGGGGN